jgi:hypothetical protein
MQYSKQEEHHSGDNNQGWQTWFFKFLVFYGFLEKPGFFH